MNRSPTVSVVVAAYNVGGYIDAALASIATQTMLPDEVIVVDDASTDDTAARARRWADRLPLIVIQSPVNVGCGPARAMAIGAATGDVIAPLDGDDIWLPDHLETVVPLVGPRTIVAAQPLRWAPGRGIDVAGKGFRPLPVPPTDRQADAIARHNFLFVSSAYWRTALDTVGGPSMSRSAEDWETWARLIVKGGCRVVAAPHVTALYRARDDSLSANENCLSFEIDICLRMLSDPDYAQHHPAIRQGLRRRRARVVYLDTIDRSDRSAIGDRVAFARAAWMDRSLNGWLAPGLQGSVTARAMIGALSPRLARRGRVQRLVRKRLITDPRTTPLAHKAAA